jgi:UDP-N-acetylmuramate: L-alanyl-gamma-D-glutamyl-meso-diaminopimelate ligase
VKHVASAAGPGDVVVALSSGSFDGFHDKLLAAIGDAVCRPGAATAPRCARCLRAVGLPRDDATDADLGRTSCCATSTAWSAPSPSRCWARTRSCATWRSTAGAARGHGLGWILADVVVQWARYRGVRRIYLLTETASDFFAAKLGFRVVDRTTVSPDVAGTTTFQRSTDSKFVAMRLDL